jgi:hypothetical protein
MTEPEKQITAGELIELLQKFDPELPVWLAHSDEPKSCYHRLTADDIKNSDIWLPGEEEPDGGQVEVPGITIGEKWYQ